MNVEIEDACEKAFEHTPNSIIDTVNTVSVKSVRTTYEHDADLPVHGTRHGDFE